MQFGPTRASYDDRLRAEVVRTGNLALASDLGVPTSTAASWLRRGAPANVVCLPDDDANDLFAARLRVRQLERRIRVLVAVVALAPARLRTWRERERRCELAETTTCPVTRPNRLRPQEIAAMKALVLSDEHRHFSIRALAFHAQRVGAVFASPSTWLRVVRERGWTRPRRRVHPQRSSVGIRAARAMEVLHVDVTVVRLLDGTRAFVQAVLDNYSRKVLTWRVSTTLEPAPTAALLRDVGERFLPASGKTVAPIVLPDAGVENVNRTVDDALTDPGIRRVLALVDIDFSNSMIEAFWKALKHRWLFLHSLDTVETVRRLIGLYVEQHNRLMPHAAFAGLTPDEVFHASAPRLADELEGRRLAARVVRLDENRKARCGVCRPTDIGPPHARAPETDSSARPRTLHLHAISVARS